MHREGLLKIGYSNIIDGLKPNNTYYRNITMAGKINVDGTCKGVQYSDYYGTWDDVIVQATVKMSLKSSYIPVKLTAGKVMLKSGTVCDLSEETCIDSDDGYTFWQSVPVTACGFEAYDVLFEGTATKFQGSLGTQHTTIFTVETQDTTFSFLQARKHTICRYTLLGTEHPKLFIFETQKGNTFKTKSKTAVQNLDMFAYVNSKFVYIETYKKSNNYSLSRYHSAKM